MKNKDKSAVAVFLLFAAFVAGCALAPEKNVSEVIPSNEGVELFRPVVDSLAPNIELRRVYVRDSVSLPTRAALDFAFYFKNPIREAGKSELPENASPVAKPLEYPFPMLDSVSLSKPGFWNREVPLAWEPFAKFVYALGGGDSLASVLRGLENVKWGMPDVFADFQKVEVLELVGDLADARFWVEISPRKWTGVPTFWGRLEHRPSMHEIRAFKAYTSETLSHSAALDYARSLAAYWYPSLNTDLEPVSQWKSRLDSNPFAVLRGNPLGTPLWVAFDVPAFRNVRTPQDSATETFGEFVRKMDTSSSFRISELEKLRDACPENSATETFRKKLSAVLDSLPAERNAWSAGGMLWFRRNANSLLAKDFTAQDSLHNPLPRLLELKNFLDSLDIQFLVVPVPTKEAVYAEKLIPGTPDTLCVDVAGRNWIRQMLASGIDVLDVFPAMLAAKAADGENFIFERNDTHWSLGGLLPVMELLAEKVTTYAWYESSGAQPGTLEMRDTTIVREGDLIAQMPKSEQGLYAPETLEVKKIYRDGEPYVGKKNSPILLMGDSFTGVFESIDGKSGGPGSLLAFATGLDVQVVTSWGGGPGVRHRAVKDKKSLSSKRLVVYMMTMRDFWQSPLDWDALR